jgi:hypothetical protein
MSRFEPGDVRRHSDAFADGAHTQHRVNPDCLDMPPNAMSNEFLKPFVRKLYRVFAWPKQRHIVNTGGTGNYRGRNSGQRVCDGNSCPGNSGSTGIGDSAPDLARVPVVGKKRRSKTTVRTEGPQVRCMMVRLA